VEELSVIIIARNEEADLPACLQGLLGLAGEIVLVDDFSTDATTAIAERHGARVLKRRFDTYGGQKQFALDNATRTWVLNVDADEVVSPELGKEIEAVLRDPGDKAGFEIPFRVHFLGRRLRFGRGASEKHLRLFRRDRAGYSVRAVHERLAVDGPVGVLRAHIDHHTYSDLHEYFDKFNRYTSLIAAQKLERGERFRPWHVLRFPFEFLSRYVLRLGFLDGWHGFLAAFLASFYTTVKYLKLWDLQRRAPGRKARP